VSKNKKVVSSYGGYRKQSRLSQSPGSAWGRGAGEAVRCSCPWWKKMGGTAVTRRCSNLLGGGVWRRLPRCGCSGAGLTHYPLLKPLLASRGAVAWSIVDSGIDGVRGSDGCKNFCRGRFREERRALRVLVLLRPIRWKNFAAWGSGFRQLWDDVQHVD